MKKILKITALVLFIGFIAIQFYRPAKTNPPIVEGETLQATTQVPEAVEKILSRSCNDCHTNNSNYPWYSEVAPMSWGVINHINEGRRELNLSTWANYNLKRKKHKLEEICEMITSGEMPHYQYLWIHWDARLSDDDKKILCDWTENEKAKLPQT
ncbi:MAG: heme-binding domain-containing protein [Pyrinomonadaceae bacterium]